MTGMEIPNPKIIILDTNVLIHNPEAIFSFDDNDVDVPITAIEELDDKKKGNGEIPYSAREALRQIDELRKTGNIAKGIKLPGGGLLKIVLVAKVNKNLKEKKSDNLIISVALKIQDENKGRKVILVSKDTAVRIKAEAVGLKSEDYNRDKTSLFQKYGKVLFADDYENGILSTRYKVKGDVISRIYGIDLSQSVKKRSAVYDISPRNIEQECALDALTNPLVEIVALTGVAGCGKTILALAAALQQTTKSSPLFTQVLVARPVVPMGGRDNDIGFLPGDVDEKLKPWMQPIFDNLEVLLHTPKCSKDGANSKDYPSYQFLIEKGILHVEALTYIRGRSLPKRYFIVDEAQNLRPLDVKTLLTRCGEGTKIVFTGDLDQIDTPYLDKQSNGLAYLISRYINEPEFCFLHMEKSARSSMADKASKLL
jgi:PhoH-like ATPase